jgi:invasion protein IalB
MLASGAAFAQQAPAAAPQQPQQPPGPVTLDLVPIQPEWTKVCGADQQTKKEMCYTTRDFGVQADQPLLAVAVFELKGADQRSMRLLLPLGLQLKPGFRFTVDKGSTESGAFDVCFQNGCFAEAKFKPAVVDSMKKDGKLTVVLKNQASFEVTLNIPLAGFGKAYDGPAIDPKVLEEQQKRLEEDLKKKAEEERKKLDAGKAPTPAPAPAGK